MSFYKRIDACLIFIALLLNANLSFSFDQLPKRCQREVDDWPQILKDALEQEIKLKEEGYFVAYHNIPDTYSNDTLTIYIFNAVLAELIYGKSPPLLPRSVLDSPNYQYSMKHLLGDPDLFDHSEQWREVGISCSPTLFSNSECNPVRDFAAGYFAGTPDGALIIQNILAKLGFEDASTLAKDIKLFGYDLFFASKGSILQIAIQKGVATNVMRLTKAWGKNLQSAQQTKANYCDKFLLKKSNRLTWQTRIVCDPALLNSDLCQLNFYHSDEIKFFEAYQTMKEFILDKILDPWHRILRDEALFLQIEKKLRKVKY